MKITTAKNVTVTINLNETEIKAIETVAELFTRISEVITDNYNDDFCRILDVDNNMCINVPSDEIGTIAMNIKEFNGTELIKLLPAD